MRVKIRYLGLTKSIVGKDRDEFYLEDKSSLRDLLERMVRKYGDRFKKEVYEPGIEDLKTDYVLTVNGVLMGQLDGIETPLKDGDDVTLMSIIYGG